MKSKLLALPIFLLLIFSPIKLEAQTSKESIIRLIVRNIPEIKHKVATSKTSWTVDKSPTLSYRLQNDNKEYTIFLNKNQKNITTELNFDLIYLRVRYNPGKFKIFILKRGDKVNIEYFYGKPYIEILNRETRENFSNIPEIVDQLKFPISFFEFNRINKRFRTKEEKKEVKNEYISIYQKQLNMIDSLKTNDLISQIEYDYHYNSILYKKLDKEKKFDATHLRKDLLHLPDYQNYINSYIRFHLKKKTISLGNGLTVNWEEAFESTLKNTILSEGNKQYLLERYLKGYKIDYPASAYKKKQAKYESFLSKLNKSTIDGKSKNKLSFPKLKIENDNTKFSKLIYDKSFEVELIDSYGNSTTLKDVLDIHEGKIVYVDFWASWCAPCRKAFPSYKSLKKEYEKKDIVFLFISSDKDADEWKKAEIKEKLTNSYLAVNYPIPKFYKDLDLRRFPRYLIFNKNGHLLKSRAPGPDSDNIRGFLNDYLTIK